MPTRAGTGGTALTSSVLLFTGAAKLAASSSLIADALLIHPAVTGTLQATGALIARGRVVSRATILLAGGGGLIASVIRVTTELFFPCSSRMIVVGTVVAADQLPSSVTTVIVDRVHIRRDDKARYRYST